ncbi:MAG: DUF5702 domain-containing protein [Peptoniphilaceae bacterium]|nr:DUF5702 domain-containing protein [Peptoniphilaceae bacterium]MDY6085865.1 DUF5702 domain-containing protein [Peptoniphilaceae bacterium]
MKKRECEFRQERGLISVFLAGILLLTVTAMAGLFDFARVANARAEMRSGLRTASHVVLSDFYKPLAYEFGVFAHGKADEAESVAQRVMDARWKETNGHESFMRPRKPFVSLAPVPDAHLSSPRVLENQILQYMEWQLPGAFLSRAAQHLKLLSQLSDAVAPLEAKVRYEAELQGVQERMNDAYRQIERLAGEKMPNGLTPLSSRESPSTEGLFTGIPALAPALQGLQKSATALDQSLAQKLQRAYEKSEEEAQETDSSTIALSGTDRFALQKEFERMKRSYTDVSRYLTGLQKSLSSGQSSLQNASDAVHGLEASAETWQSAISAMPNGTLSQNLFGDFLAETSNHETKGMDELRLEMEQLEKTAQSVSTAWETIRVDGKAFKDLTFDQWLKGRLNSLEEEQRAFTFDATDVDASRAEGYRSGVPISDKAFKTQQTMRQQAEKDRSGLFEFIAAWAKKQKAMASARHAAQAGLPQFAGGIGDWISADVLSQYHTDAAPLSHESTPLVEVGGEAAMVSGAMENLHRLSDDLKGFSLTTPQEQVKLVTYWYGMFSHRLTGMGDNGRLSALSLNGLPLDQRPLYGAELEFILHGRSSWMANLQQTQWRIASIRLMANLIAAFSSSTLYAETSQLAFALAGWTGFAVPFVQSALLTLLAIGETHLDMQALLAGEAVAMMKTDETWQFSLNGIRKLSHEAVADVFDYAEDELLAGVEAGGAVLTESMNKMRQQAVTAARAAFERPILTYAERLLMATEPWEVQDLEGKIGSALSALQSRSGSGVVAAAVSQAYATLRGQSGAIAQAVLNAQSVKRESGEETSGALESLNGALRPILQNAGSGLDAVVEKETAALSQGISNLRANAQGNVDQKIDEWLDRFHAQLGTGSDIPAASGGLKMDYGDYVLLLLVMYSSTARGKNAMLSQTAQLMQAETKAPALTEAPTAFTWELNAEVHTLFLEALGVRSDPVLSFRESWEEGYGRMAVAGGAS